MPQGPGWWVPELGTGLGCPWALRNPLRRLSSCWLLGSRTVGCLDMWWGQMWAERRGREKGERHRGI